MTSPIFDLQTVQDTQHHPAMNDLVDLLCFKTGNTDRGFFQAEVAYFLGLIPSTMRAQIDSPERGILPINIYSIALATSGFGKGHSVSLLEDVISGFRDTFSNRTFNQIAEQSLYDMAVDIAAAKGGDEDKEMEALELEFKRQGNYVFMFDSGTGPAVKQLRYKLQLARVGAINFQMDEIGSNLQANTEVINTLLELYDLGKIKTKLVKSTGDNERGADLTGVTPSNVLMFGTTHKLFDGSKIEEEFFSFLETGYARRCFFGIGNPEVMTGQVDPERVYNSLVSASRSMAQEKWRKQLAKFADEIYFDRKIEVPTEVGIQLTAYRLFCEQMAAELPEHEVIRKAEWSHRYFKALKLAGVYAFLDESDELTLQNLLQAIKVAEESGVSFQKLLKRERNFVRLAKYIASTPGELTHADLVDDVPFYPNSATPRREMMDLAMAWGVGNHVVIKKNVVSGVDFFSGSTLQETDLQKIRLSYSSNMAHDYKPVECAFEDLPDLLTMDGMHWCNHTFENGHRAEDNVIPGFNCLVVDVDGDMPLPLVQDLMKDFTYITATTKRHTPEENRFRLIMPMNYELSLDKEEYREFMDAFLLWLPFDSDRAANQRSKKWMTMETSPETGLDCEVKYHVGPSLVDVLPFIPKTKKNAEFMTKVVDLGNLDHLERWFLDHMDEGGRNNNLLNFAMMLKDAGMGFDALKDKVITLNAQSHHPLKEEEIYATILKSVGQKMDEPI